MDKYYKSNNLPKGWVMAKLSDMVIDVKKDFVDGPFGSDLKANEYRNEGIPVFKIQNIKAGYFLDKNIQYISVDKAEELKRHSFQLGDIIITKLGEPLGLCCKVPQKYPKGIIVADLMRVRPSEIIVDTNYLTYAINSDRIQDQFKNITKGTTRSRVNLTIVRDIIIPLPPFNEQKRIASKLDEVFSELEKSKEQLNSSLLQLNIYRQSIFKNAFEGNLTKKWRNENTFETSESFLKNLKKQAHSRYEKELKFWKSEIKIWELDKKRKKPIKPTKIVESKPLKIDELNALPKIPKNWLWVKNNDLLYYVTSGSRDWKKYYSSKGAYFIRTQDIKTNSLVIENIACVELPQDVEGKRSLVQKGDLLMTITGANVGKIAHINETIPESYVSQSVALIKPINIDLAPYLHIYFQSYAFGAKMISNSVYGVGRPVLNLENIREAPVALPPPKEQLAIVEEIESQLTIIKNLEQTLLNCINKLKELRRSTLKNALEGKLLKQDFEDEPAEFLLDRIKEKRNEYYSLLKDQNKIRKKPEKMRKNNENDKDILTILIKSRTPISAKEVWEQSIYKDDIEQFYSELKKVQNKVIEVEKGILSYKHEDR